MTEAWATVQVCDHDLEVSSFGVVRRLPDMWVYSQRNQRGYRYIQVMCQGKPKNILVHRLVMLAFCGPDNREVNHKNGRKDDNRLENLEYMTRSENVQHAWDTGLQPRKRGGRDQNGKHKQRLPTKRKFVGFRATDAERAKLERIASCRECGLSEALRALLQEAKESGVSESAQEAQEAMSGIDVVQGALDVGQAADWITPLSGMIRGGRVFIVRQDEISVAEVWALLSGAGVRWYADQVMSLDGDRVYIFRVSDEDAPTVRALLGFAEPAAQGGGYSTWWMWALLVAVFVVALTLGALWAAAGGAL